MFKKRKPTNKECCNWKRFCKTNQKGLKLGATALDFSNRENSKYFVTLKDGKKGHFGSVIKV